MITYYDLVKQQEFRDFVEERLATTQEDCQYSFSTFIPRLYKYRALSEYAVDDIVNGRLTATNIGNFNDLFDGAMHRYGTHDERKNMAENKWDELERLRVAAGLSESQISKEHYVDMFTEHFRNESRLKLRVLAYLGTYVGSFSTRFDSTLMWGHYAESNTGICIEYDFNMPTSNPLQRKLIFPVSYSKTPVQINDLLDDENADLFKYPLDAAVLCSALNKSHVWCYEKEWRLVLMCPFIEDQKQRISILVDKPISITFGFHFLKSFFYYESRNEHQRNIAGQRIKNLISLLDYMKEHSITPYIIVPSIGEYKLERKSIEIEELRSFITVNFEDGEPEDVRYYYVLHDELMDLLDM